MQGFTYLAFSREIRASIGFRPWTGSRILLPNHLSTTASYALTVTVHKPRYKQKKKADNWARLVFMHPTPRRAANALQTMAAVLNLAACISRN